MPRSLANGMGSVSALNAFAVTPSDAADLATGARGIYVGTTGDLKVTTLYGDTVTFADIAAGVIHPIAVARVWSTGTTAADIVAVY